MYVLISRSLVSNFLLKFIQNNILNIFFIILQSYLCDMSLCSTGLFHTICLSDDGVVYSIGGNGQGQLGLGSKMDTWVPKPIQNLPKIKMVSCGLFFTFCVDTNGSLWGFGGNSYNQLGIEMDNVATTSSPIKIEGIPPVQSISCGRAHSLIIVVDEDSLWSVGQNEYGQLCLGDKKQYTKPQKTLFSNISKISAGGFHSLFQNIEGEIYSCGSNKRGQLGLGKECETEIIATLIPNQPPNIIQFSCGYYHSLFLDSEGNVFSVGSNAHGSLGLNHGNNQNVLSQIQDIPLIKLVSCSSESSYLIDYDGNLWSFGQNNHGQLGHGDNVQRKIPTKIPELTEITQISTGTYSDAGNHVFVKDSQNKIFVIGINDKGQLGTGNNLSNIIPEEINSDYFSIWGDFFTSRAKSARK